LIGNNVRINGSGKMDLNKWYAKNVYQQIIKSETEFIENSAVIINKDNKGECRVYVEYDVGGYDNLKIDEYYIPNCSDKEYKMFAKYLPRFRGFKETKFFYGKDEFGVNMTRVEFLYFIGRIW